MHHWSLALLLVPGVLRQDSRPDASAFMRYVAPPAGDPSLQSAITTYRGPKGETVALIAAIHIADRAHYQELQREFTRYDALLYELVADPDLRPKAGEVRGGWVGAFQRFLKNLLELEFQLDGVDYTPANFVHADLTPAEFARQQKEKGESIFKLLFDAMVHQMRQQRAAEDDEDGAGAKADPMADLLVAIQRDGRAGLRQGLAQVFGDVERMAAGISPEGKPTVLLEGRNERALEVLQEQVQAGKRNLAIYYGAAHLPHMERRLMQLGYTKVAQRWLVAWDLKRPQSGPAPGSAGGRPGAKRR